MAWFDTRNTGDVYEAADHNSMVSALVSGGTNNAIITADGIDGHKIKGSGITIVTTIGSDDTTVPTSKAVKNVTDGKAAASHTHTEGDVTNLTTDLAAKAPLVSPAFTGTVTTPAIKITGGTPGVGKVLVSDADGDGAWTTPAPGTDFLVVQIFS